MLKIMWIEEVQEAQTRFKTKYESNQKVRKAPQALSKVISYKHIIIYMYVRA